MEKCLTIKRFPPECEFVSIALRIIWGGGRTSHSMNYMGAAPDDHNIISINGRDVIILQGRVLGIEHFLHYTAMLLIYCAVPCLLKMVLL